MGVLPLSFRIRISRASARGIACGTGWTTENLVRSGAIVTAIELTKKRLAMFGLEAEVREVDAENLPFLSEIVSFAVR